MPPDTVVESIRALGEAAHPRRDAQPSTDLLVPRAAGGANRLDAAAAHLQEHHRLRRDQGGALYAQHWPVGGPQTGHVGLDVLSRSVLLP